MSMYSQSNRHEVEENEEEILTRFLGPTRDDAKQIGKKKVFVKQ